MVEIRKVSAHGHLGTLFDGLVDICEVRSHQPLLPDSESLLLVKRTISVNSVLHSGDLRKLRCVRACMSRLTP